MAGEAILVIDDNPLNLKLTRILLRGEGYQVHEAQDSREALEALQTLRPSLILMDIQMPGVDGLALARQLKSDPATRSVPILALTACAMRGDEQRAYQAGCDGYISKPIDTRTMPEVIRSYLDTPEI